MNSPMKPLLLLTAALALLGCADGQALDPESRVEVNVAALSLEGVGDAVWDLAVESGAGTPETVFAVRVKASQYGAGASASYVGPCDAQAGGAQDAGGRWSADNTVSVRLLGIYEDALSGSVGAYGDAAPAGSLPFQDPGLLTRTVTCSENADAAVHFEVAVLRPAQQGFFDVAVSFNDLFCSAKYDCGTSGSPINLLHDADGDRSKTHVLGFACTAGASADIATTLWFGDVTLTCAGTTPSVSTVSPLAGDGNLCAAGAADGSSDPDACAAGTTLAAAGPLFQAAIFKGQERFDSVSKVYLNVSLGIEDAFPAGTTCALSFEATADDADDPALPSGELAEDQVYPYVSWALADVGACVQNHEVDAAGSAVLTAYSSTGKTFAESFSGAVAPSAPLWPVQADGPGVEFGSAFAFDAQGTVVVGGYFQQDTTFGATTLTSVAAYDAFVGKLDANGAWLWVRHLAGANHDYVTGLDTDSAGNIYVVGYFYEDIQLGATTLTSLGHYDMFVAKLDPAGQWLWVRQAGGVDADTLYDVAVSPGGDVYITGDYANATSIGGTALSNPDYNNGYVATLDTAGAWGWVTPIALPNSASRAIARDAAGALYVAGEFTGSGTVAATTLTSSSTDGFVVKLDAAGVPLWALQIGGANGQFPRALAVGAGGDVFVAGHHTTEASFGTTTLTAVGSYDSFVARVVGGSWSWARALGGAGLATRTNGATTDLAGNVYTAGYFADGTIDVGGTPLTSAGGNDIFLASLDATGAWRWAERAGSDQTGEIANEVAASGGYVYMTGGFAGVADFGAETRTATGDRDLFISRTATDGAW